MEPAADPKKRVSTERMRGSTQIEHLILVATVAIGFAAAAIPLGALLLGYHEGIEFVLALPVP